ncbi:MAG: hypothetical protein M3069_30265 [Chloroflexota bacterium]|nr:hypothetical protein [Chloroflexota bacterium]
MDRFTSIVVAGVLGLVALGLAVAVLFRGHQPTPDLSSPSGVVLAYVLAEQRQDPQSAWDLLAPSAQARFDHDRFLALAGRRGGSDSSTREYFTTQSEQITDDTATVVLVRTSVGSGGFFGSGSYSSTNTVSLTRQGADWRITIPPADDYWLIAKP